MQEYISISSYCTDFDVSNTDDLISHQHGIIAQFGVRTLSPFIFKFILHILTYLNFVLHKFS